MLFEKVLVIDSEQASSGRNRPLC